MSEHDEYGLEKPHKSWTERTTEAVTCPPSYDDFGKMENQYGSTVCQLISGVITAPVAALAGHFMDGTPGLNHGKTGAFVAEMEHGAAVDRYQRKRNAIEGGPPYLPSERTDYSDLGPGECSPEQGDVNADGVPYFLERPADQSDRPAPARGSVKTWQSESEKSDLPEPTYQWMAD